MSSNGAGAVDDNRLSLRHFADLQRDEAFKRWYDEEKNKKDDHDESDVDLEDAVRARLPILQMLHDAGVSIAPDVLYALPTWEEFQNLYGGDSDNRRGKNDNESDDDGPVAIGLETCRVFRDTVPAESRYVGVAGQQNSGTTALSRYLSLNLMMRDNPNPLRGIMPGVPWMKHGWASLRESEQFTFVTDRRYVFPVVIIRDPYYWMRR